MSMLFISYLFYVMENHLYHIFQEGGVQMVVINQIEEVNSVQPYNHNINS